MILVTVMVTEFSPLASIENGRVIVKQGGVKCTRAGLVDHSRWRGLRTVSVRTTTSNESDPDRLCLRLVGWTKPVVGWREGQLRTIPRVRRWEGAIYDGISLQAIARRTG